MIFSPFSYLRYKIISVATNFYLGRVIKARHSGSAVNLLIHEWKLKWKLSRQKKLRYERI